MLEQTANHHLTAKKQQLQNNRHYNCAKRNQHYENSYLLFHQLQSSANRGDDFASSGSQHLISEFSKEISNTLEFARESVFPFKRHRLLQYRDDRQYGILREELIFVSFLEEMVSSIKYMENRLETDERLHDFQEELEAYKQEHEKHGNINQAGFVTSVLNSISELKHADRDHIREIFGSINQRFQVGNKLFSLIREMQPL